jgi:hypothetical protein
MKGHYMAENSTTLKLNQEEIELLRNSIILGFDIEEKLRCTIAGKREFAFTHEELEELAGYVAGEANHTEDQDRQDMLDCLCDKIESHLAEFE